MGAALQQRRLARGRIVGSGDEHPVAPGHRGRGRHLGRPGSGADAHRQAARVVEGELEPRMRDDRLCPAGRTGERREDPRGDGEARESREGVRPLDERIGARVRDLPGAGHRAQLEAPGHGGSLRARAVGVLVPVDQAHDLDVVAVVVAAHHERDLLARRDVETVGVADQLAHDPVVAHGPPGPTVACAARRTSGRIDSTSSAVCSLDT